MAPRRSESPHPQIQSPHQQSWRTHGRASRPERKNPQHHNSNRFFSHRPQNQAPNRIAKRHQQHGPPSIVRRPQLHPHRRNARRPRGAEWQRQDDSAPLATGRPRSNQGRDSPRRLAAHRLLRPDPHSRSRRNSAPRSRPGRRFHHLSRPRNSRGRMGGPIPLHPPTTTPAPRPPLSTQPLHHPIPPPTPPP